MESSTEVSYFNAGPAKIPNEVLCKVSEHVKAFGNTGVGVLEISHRSEVFLNVLSTAVQKITELLSVPANYKIIFMQGGGCGQFAAVALNLMGKTGKADYLVTGYWSKQAAGEARKFGTVQHVLTEGAPFGEIPDASTWKLDPEASYLYYCDNETIHGVEFPNIPTPPPGVPLVCDMSSNICSRTFDMSKFGIVFAGAQKNIGCAGVTLVIIREDLLAVPSLPYCPSILNYATMAKHNSTYNTPPVFAIDVLMETVSWVMRQGGLPAMTKVSIEKSATLYAAIDDSGGFYNNSICVGNRSRMNVVFTIGEGDARKVDLEQKFISEAAKCNLLSLKGHRSVGGMRASLLNAITMQDVRRLVAFMETFKKQNS